MPEMRNKSIESNFVCKTIIYHFLVQFLCPEKQLDYSDQTILFAYPLFCLLFTLFVFVCK